MVNIYLVGFMGAGKTSVGERLARSLGARFCDLDERLSERFGRPIAEVFQHEGEAAFRTAETEELTRLAGGEGWVVATGGGAFVREANRAAIEGTGGISVFLEVPWDVLRRRLEQDNGGRPVYQSAERARELYEERLPDYRRATRTVSLSGDESPDEIVEMIANAVRGAPCGI
jgi:shikimate kinase